MLVYYEMHAMMDAAIAREKSLKRWRREWKYRLIGQMNPEWENLFNPETGEIGFGSPDERNLVQER
jgi:putative endonuclease